MPLNIRAVTGPRPPLSQRADKIPADASPIYLKANRMVPRAPARKLTASEAKARIKAAIAELAEPATKNARSSRVAAATMSKPAIPPRSPVTAVPDSSPGSARPLRPGAAQLHDVRELCVKITTIGVHNKQDAKEMGQAIKDSWNTLRYFHRTNAQSEGFAKLDKLVGQSRMTPRDLAIVASFILAVMSNPQNQAYLS